MSIVRRTAQMIRFDHWWWSKLPPLMAVIYLQLLRQSDQFQPTAALIAAFATTIFMVAAYGHVINDVFDVRVDLVAGKPNSMANTAPVVRLALCIALAAGAFVPGTLLHFARAAMQLIFLNLVWPTIYSVPPLRLKERGILGIACDAAGSHMTPTLMAIAVFSSAPLDNLLLVLLTLWATALGLKGILHHQLQDSVADIAAGVRTYVTEQHFDVVARLLPVYNLAVELPISTALALAVLPYSVLPGLGLVLFCGIELSKYRHGFQFVLTADARTLRPSIPFANELFYTAWLPLAAVLELGTRSPAWLWLVGVHIVTLNQQLRIAAKDAFSVIRLGVPLDSQRWQQFMRSRLF